VSDRFLISDHTGAGQRTPTSRDRKTTQIILALFFLALPGLLLPFVSREKATDLWVRAGLPKNIVKQVLIPNQTSGVQYALAADKGIYRSADNGLNWVTANADLPRDRVGRIGLHTLAAAGDSPSVLYVGRRGITGEAREFDAGLYWTDNGGSAWMAAGQDMAGKEVRVIAAMPPLQPAASVDHSPSLAGSATPLEPSVETTSASSVLCAATPGELYRSMDGGRSWQRMDWRGIETSILSLAIRSGNPDAIYVGTQGGGLYGTENGGVSWVALNEGLEHLDIHCIAIATTRSEVMYLGTDGGVYKSTNAGQNWVRLAGPTQGRLAHTIVVHPRSEDLLCVGLQYGAACCSTDGGVQWQALQRGAGKLTFLSLTLDPRNESVLWAGTTDGIWRYVFGASSSWVNSPALARPTPTTRTTDAGKSASTATPPAAQATATPSPNPTTTSTPVPTVTPTATLTPSSTATRTRLPSATLRATAVPTQTATTVPATPVPASPANTPVVR